MGALGHCYNLEYVSLGCLLECTWTSNEIIDKAYVWTLTSVSFKKSGAPNLLCGFTFSLSVK